MTPFDSANAPADDLEPKGRRAEGGRQDPGAAAQAAVPAEAFTLELLHLADQEARSDAVFDAPRLSAVLNGLRAQDLGEDGEPDNTLTLSSGDAWLPGLFYNASDEVFGAVGVGDVLIQNELGIEAIAFGNHEFDQGPAIVADLIDGTFDTDGDAATEEVALSYDVEGVPAFAGTDFPYLSGNLDFSTSEDLAPLAVADGQPPQPNAVSGSTVLTVGGEKIGVVAATTPTLGAISSPGAVGVAPAPFDGDPTDEQLDGLAAIVQEDVDALLAANPDMNKVILLAHMQQISIELRLAERLENVDIIVAGGSNTRLFDEDDRPRDGDSDQGQYPQFVTNAGGGTTAVVNTDGSYKYVGRLVLDFDADGNLIVDSYDPQVSGAYATDAAGVAALGAEGLVDPEVQAIADAIGEQILATESNVFGVSDVFLNGLRAEVRSQETNLGNLTADANLAYARTVDPTTLISIKNGGGIRDDIGEIVVPAGGSDFIRTPNEPIFDADGNVVKPAGGISQNDIGNALSFNNGLSLVTVTTEQLAAILEHGVSASTYDADGAVDAQGRFPQISGVRFSFDPDNAAGERIVNAGVFTPEGELVAEIVRDGEVVDNGSMTFRVVTLGFLAGGGDGYPFPQGPEADIVDLVSEERTGEAIFADDGTEQDVLAEHLADNFLTNDFESEDTPIDEDTRIQNLNFRADAVFGEVAQPVLINEVLGSTTGTDSEYIELFGEAGASLAGLSLIVVESDDLSANGRIDFRYDFADDAALGDNGFFLLANELAESTYGVAADAEIAGNSIENSAYTLALVETSSLGGEFVTGSEGVRDAVAVSDPDGGSFFFDAPVIGPDGSFHPAGAQRVTDGLDTDTAADWRLLDFNNGAPNNPVSGGTQEPETPEFTRVSEIQGAGATTPRDGDRVTVQAVVTLVSPQLNGFFIQEQVADYDDDPNTSEGIFVFTGSDPSVSVGDLVTVTGEAGEYFDATQLSNVEITVDETGVELPPAVEVSLPLPDAADPQGFYEPLEGMRVRVVAAEGERLAVTDTYTPFGEVGVTSGDLLRQPTQVHDSFTEAQEELAEANARDFLLFENAVDDSLSGAPRAGDGIVGGAIEGVLHYTFDEYKVETPGAVEFDSSVNPYPRQDEPEDVGGRLKVASFNVLNYFTTLSGQTETGLDPRGAETEEQLAIQTSKIVAALAAMDAAVVGLIEIENDSGAATEALVQTLNDQVGAGTYDYIDTGVVGTDAIKQAIIYKPAEVAPVGDFAVLDTQAFVAPYTPGEPQSRPAIAQSFAEVGTGETFTFSVNHFKSKGSETGAVVDGEPDDSPVEGSAALTRVAAAEALAEWLESDPTGVGDPDQLTVGDFNAYAMERAIEALVEEGFNNLLEPEDFSYQFDGRFGTLDYAFANDAMLDQVTGATVWHANSLEAYSLQYDGSLFEEFGDANSPFASSDHDPVVVGLDLDSRPVLVADPNKTDRLVGTDVAEVFRPGGGPVNQIVTGGGADTIEFLPALDDGAKTRFIVADFDPLLDSVDFSADDVAFARETGGALIVAFEGDDQDSAIFRGVDSLDQLLADDPFAFV